MDHRIAALGLVVAHHYALLRKKVLESREAGGVQLLTTEEARLADYLGDTIEGMAGKAIGDYCRAQFQRGWLTVDLRAYKIKFVLTRLRDLLPEGRTKEELAASLEAYVEPAERLAGCVADGKRRNRAALEERARLAAQRREERAAEKAEKARKEERAKAAKAEKAEKAAERNSRRRAESAGQLEFDELLAEVDSSPQAEEPAVEVRPVTPVTPVTPARPEKEEKTEKTEKLEKLEKPVRARSAKTRKTREERAEERARKLEKEILSNEYGDDPEDEEPRRAEEGEDEEDYGREDREYLRDDLCSHYARGFASTCRYGDAGRLEGTGGEYTYDPDND